MKFKRIRVSANVNGRKALDSIPCGSLEEAMTNLARKVQRYEETSGKTVHVLSMVVGRRDAPTSDQYGIAKDMHPDARVLAARLFPTATVEVRDHGIW